MESGKLRHTIRFLNPVRVRDSRGNLITELVEGLPTAANVRQLSGRELVQRQAVRSEATWSIEIRYQNGITPDTLLRYDGRTFNVLAVNDPEQRRRRLILDAKEHHVGQSES
jgi:SPP1 family predicted phage head-tail adaptor